MMLALKESERIHFKSVLLFSQALNMAIRRKVSIKRGFLFKRAYLILSVLSLRNKLLIEAIKLLNKYFWS